jgi:hypothetical protein
MLMQAGGGGGGGDQDLAFTIRVFRALQELEDQAARTRGTSAPQLICVNNNFVTCCRSAEREGKGKSEDGRCANCMNMASPTFVSLSRLNHHAVMALLHAAGVSLARVVAITSTDSRPLTAPVLHEHLPEATQAFIASSTDVGLLHGEVQQQAPHLERVVVHPGRLWKLQEAFRGQEPAARALLDLATALAPTAAASLGPLRLLRRLQGFFEPNHWLCRQLYLGWLGEEDEWEHVSTAGCDVRFDMACPPISDPSDAIREVLDLLHFIAEWAWPEEGVDAEEAIRWLERLTCRAEHAAEIVDALGPVEQGLEEHVADGLRQHPGLLPSGYATPSLEAAAAGGMLPLAAVVETFPRAETCVRGEEVEEGEGREEAPSIFQRHGMAGELCASLTFASTAELVAAGDGLEVEPGRIFDLERVKRSFSTRLVANICDTNDGASRTTNNLPCPSPLLWNQRSRDFVRRVVSLPSFSVAFPLIVSPGQPPASKKGQVKRLGLLQTIALECPGAKMHEFSGELRRCCSALNGGAASNSLRLTAVLLPGSLPLLVLHGLPQGSAEGTVFADALKGAATKALPPQLLQSRYRLPELEVCNLLRALRGLPCISLHDAPDQQRALDPASVLGHALSSRGGA